MGLTLLLRIRMGETWMSPRSNRLPAVAGTVLAPGSSLPHSDPKGFDSPIHMGPGADASGLRSCPRPSGLTRAQHSADSHG